MALPVALVTETVIRCGGELTKSGCTYLADSLLLYGLDHTNADCLLHVPDDETAKRWTVVKGLDTLIINN